jgi:hypothetical protein
MENTPEVVAEVPQEVQVSAPEQVVTATPETAEASPDTVKTFTQEEVDAMIGKRLARERRTWERDRVKVASPAPQAAAPAPVSQSQFESVEQYAEALAAQKAEQLLQQRELERQQTAILESYHDREEQARDKYEDFETVAYNPSLKITTVMAQTIQASDVGPDVAYYLGLNPKEADRISRLPPFLQAKEIGKIEAKVADSPPVKKPSNAPAPIQPVAASSSRGPAYDTTDPRSLKTMSTSEWIEAERQRQIRAYEAKHGR